MLCGYFGVSRSGYYKASLVAQKEQLDEHLVLLMVRDVRRRHPRIGGRKLYSLLKSDVATSGIKLGRDRFFDLLGRHSMLVKRRRKYAHTTDSYHHFRVYRNLLKHRCLNGAHQGWVSDITYIRCGKEFMYLFLVTDAYSRKIVGWDLSDSLAIPGAVRALKMAIGQCPKGQRVIHHSDRGIQYCSKGYTGLLKEAGIEISMTEENHCYENAIAERVNGILKQEYGLEETFSEAPLATRAVREAIGSYNNERPHWSLGLETPDRIHRAA